jgi:hypothetical protein
LLKQAVLFLNFQSKNEIHNQFLVTFSCYRSTEENGANYLPSRDNTDFHGVFRPFVEDKRIFSKPHSAILVLRLNRASAPQ